MQNRTDPPASTTSPDPDRWLRRLMYAVVIAVAAFAAVVSFSHIYDLGRGHGQSGTAARLLPLSVDGLIVAASLIMLISSRRTGGVHWLTRLMLWLGIGATVGANVAYGIPFGPLGAIVSAWPALAFVGAVEMVMVAVRPGAERPARVTARVTAWKPDPIRKIATEEGCAPKTAQLVQRRERAAVKAAFNGNGIGPH